MDQLHVECAYGTKNKQTRWSMVRVLGPPSTAATSTWTWMLLLTNLYFFAIPLVFSCLKIRCWGPCQISAPPSLVEDHGRLWRSWSWGPSHRHRRPDDPGAKKKEANIRPPNNTPTTKLRGVNLAFTCHRRDTSFFFAFNWHCVISHGPPCSTTETWAWHAGPIFPKDQHRLASSEVVYSLLPS